MPPRSKYAPLTAYLLTRPPETATVTLTMAAIEAILGQPLPRLAYAAGRSWWRNAPRVPQARAWRSIGWAVTAVWRGPGEPRQWTVTFNRVVTETTA